MEWGWVVLLVGIGIIALFGLTRRGAKKDGGEVEAERTPGTCIFCGKPTGSSETQHAACERKHALGANQIQTAFSSIHATTEPAEFKTLIEGIARTSLVGDTELHALAINGLKSMVDSAAQEGGRGNETDNDHVASLIKEFGLTANDLGLSGIKFVKMQILHGLDKGLIHGGVTLEGAEILLEPGEKPIWGFKNVRYDTTRTRTQYVGASHGISVRLMKGLSYRIGSFKGEPIKTEYESHEGDGILVIASRNVYFRSEEKVIKIPIKKILSVRPYSDAIEIARDGAAPQTFTVDDPSFAADAITRLHQVK